VSSAAPPSPRVRRRRGPAATLFLSLLVTALDASFLALALGGYRALAAHPRALALVAIWAVAGVALALLRPVGAQDVVRREPEPRWVLIALGLVPLLIPPIAALGELLSIAMLPGGGAPRWAGVALVALGITLRIAAMARLGARFSPFLAVQREHGLETTGLYRRVRHPGYLGALLASFGAVLAFGSSLGLVPFALFALLMARRVAREEALLAARFGEEWIAYRARSGAFLPRP
jgi:protein-S-isoprenylcysteine O-methyltransferase Ste14